VELGIRLRAFAAPGSYFGLQSRRRESHASRPQLRITKEGDAYRSAGIIFWVPLGKTVIYGRRGLQLAGRELVTAPEKVVSLP